MAEGKIPEEFEVGEPVLVCRWRLSAGKLPALNRHMRALGARSVHGKPISKQLVGWAKQHIEWTLQDGSFENPDGTLMLMVDELGRAAMAVGPYEALADTSIEVLAQRARAAEVEASNTNVAPETLWATKGDTLMVNVAVGDGLAGSTSLIVDLAQTLGMPVEYRESMLDELAAQPAEFTDVFLVSDEHGVVVASDTESDKGKRFADGWQTLLEKTGRKGGSAYTKRA